MRINRNQNLLLRIELIHHSSESIYSKKNTGLWYDNLHISKELMLLLQRFELAKYGEFIAGPARPTSLN